MLIWFFITAVAYAKVLILFVITAIIALNYFVNCVIFSSESCLLNIVSFLLD